MAKGNMFQGMARGKVGDVVFYRMDGEQMARVRNRHPKNPKTAAQLYQRAIMATIVQAYAAGAEIFDHSFQGKQVGMENMRTFLSRNMNILRTNVQQDVNEALALAKQVGAVVAPKSVTPIPVVGLVASEGSLVQELFTYNTYGTDGVLQLKTPANPSNTSQKLAEWAENVGIRAKDIYTMVAFANSDNTIRYKLPGSEGNYATQFMCSFGFYRMTVKDTINDVSLSSATFGDLFDIESDGNVFTGEIATKKLMNQTITVEDLFLTEPQGSTFAIIRSRDDSKLRSTAVMVNVREETSYGIKSSYILDVWEKETDSLGNSTLILEGGDVEGGIDVTPSTQQPGGGNPPMGGD